MGVHHQIIYIELSSNRASSFPIVHSLPWSEHSPVHTSQSSLMRLTKTGETLIDQHQLVMMLDVTCTQLLAIAKKKNLKIGGLK